MEWGKGKRDVVLAELSEQEGGFMYFFLVGWGSKESVLCALARDCTFAYFVYRALVIRARIIYLVLLGNL